MSKGYIRLHRQLQDCWVWQDERFSKGQAWVDLLLSANHKDKKVAYKYNIKNIQRGQFITSMHKLAERWKWSRTYVSNFLKLLENDNMITTEVTSTYTLITIVNYDNYQFFEDDEKPPTLPEGLPQVLRTDIVNNISSKKPSETRENPIRPVRVGENAHFEEFWEIYKKKKDKSRAHEQYLARLNEGYSEQELLTACKNYMAECEKKKTEERYIKDAKTFLSIHKPFLDYLKGGEEETDGTDSETHEFTDEELKAYEHFKIKGFM